MIRFCLITAFVLVCMSATLNAGVLTPQEALERVYEESAKRSGPDGKDRGNLKSKYGFEVKDFEVEDMIKMVGEADAPQAYIFSTPRSGFVIVNADDRGVALLGYGDGVLDADKKLPPALLWWIGEYATELKGLCRSRARGAAWQDNEAKAPIQPLCSTKWGQVSPYNDKSPLLEGKRTYSGCVATSMAQLMKYHNWPAEGRGAHSYTWGDTSLSMDFSKVKFDYDNMLDSYPAGGYSAAQGEAVANLMLACGISVDMNYGLAGSGAEGEEQSYALREYFGYGASTTLLERRHFHISDWENILYESLKAGAPVAYMGHSQAGGHAFVIDGYADGYFHVNWGWTGDADGYFRITDLNPYEESTPGTLYGYNMDQKAVVFALPEYIRDTPLAVISNTATLSTSYDSRRGVVTLSGKFEYFGNTSRELTVGAILRDSQGGVTTLAGRAVNMSSGSPLDEISVALATPADGGYTISPAYEADGKWYEISAPVGHAKNIPFTVADGEIVFGETSVSNISVTGMAAGSPFYMGRVFEISFDLVNDNPFEQGVQYWVVVIGSGDRIIWNWDPEVAILDGDSSRHVVFQQRLPFFNFTGEMEIGVVRQEEEKILLLGEPLRVNLQYPPSGHVFTADSDGLIIEDAEEVGETVRYSYGIMSAEGYYAFKLRSIVYDENGDAVLLNLSRKYDIVTEGETARFDKELSVKSLPGGKEYTLRLYANLSDGIGVDDFAMPCFGEARFKTAVSGVDAVGEDTVGTTDAIYVSGGRLVAPETAKVYDIAGRGVDRENLLPGIYLVIVGERVAKVALH